jgi:hypothetical protein
VHAVLWREIGQRASVADRCAPPLVDAQRLRTTSRQRSAFAGSAGWQATDKNPWGTHFNLDQPALQDTLAWYYGLVRKGYMATFDPIGGSSGSTTVPDKQ